MRRARRNRIDRHGGEIERLALQAEAEAGPGVPVQFWVSTTFDRDKEFNTMEYRFTRLQDVASREPAAPLAAPGGGGGGGGGGLTVMTYAWERALKKGWR